MTEQELKMLHIAKGIIDSNSVLEPKLSGSLLLIFLGFSPRREAADIDIVCKYISSDENDEFYPVMPDGFKLCAANGSRSCVNAIQFINEDGLKVEFIASGDEGTESCGMMCCSVFDVVKAKLSYAKNDSSEQSRTKHLDDLIYMFGSNPIANLLSMSF